MKPATRFERSSQPLGRREARTRSAQRKHVALWDFTDCLLHAYEFVSQRAYQKFVERGGEPGRELEDWLSAERELLLPISVDFEESDDFIRALASAPGFPGSEIAIGIEARWIAILAYREESDDIQSSQVFCMHQLPAEIDPNRSEAILSEGLLGIRLAKTHNPRRQ
jgi:HSP20 family molecular chaperone IbpA